MLKRSPYSIGYILELLISPEEMAVLLGAARLAGHAPDRAAGFAQSLIFKGVSELKKQELDVLTSEIANELYNRKISEKDVKTSIRRCIHYNGGKFKNIDVLCDLFGEEEAYSFLRAFSLPETDAYLIEHDRQLKDWFNATLDALERFRFDDIFYCS